MMLFEVILPPRSSIHILCLRTLAVVGIFTGLRLQVVFGIAKACLSGSALSLRSSPCCSCSTGPLTPRARLWQSYV